MQQNLPAKTNSQRGVAWGDHQYHFKQKDPVRSMQDEMKQMYMESRNFIEKKTETMVNKLTDVSELYYKLREHKKQYTDNYGKYCNDVTIDKMAIDRDPLLSKFQKTFEQQMINSAIDKHGTSFLKNTTATSYAGYGGSAHFMIRALSYIYPMLIIQPLPKLTWREDWPILEDEGWAQFGVFLTANRVSNPIEVNEESNDSGRVQAQFGEQIFQNITIRQDIVWDSTPEFYADSSMNNGLVSWVYFESLKRGFDEKINSIYLNGDNGFGLTGLLSNTHVTRIPSGGSWAQINSGTGERYSTTDLIALTQQVEQQSNGVYTAKRIMMSLKLKPYVIQPRSAYTSTSPIGYVAGQAWGVDFEKQLENARYNPYLNNAATDGSPYQIAVAYDYATSMAHIGIPYFMFGEPISWENHKYVLPFLTRTGGWRLIQAPSVAILDNISYAAS